MKKQAMFVIGAVALCISLLARAQVMEQELDQVMEEEPEPEMCECPPEPVIDNSWIGSLGLGMVVTSGNTENTNINSNIDITRDLERWRHNLHLDGLYTADEQGSTAERYFASWQSDYKLSERDYVFGYGSYEDDRFSAYEFQATVVIGYGRTLLATEDKNLNVEIGPGYRASRTAEVYEEVNGERVRTIVNPDGSRDFNLLEDNVSEDEAIVRLAEHFDWQFSANSKFVQEFNVEVGAENTVARGLLALESQIAGSLFVRLYYAIKHNTDVPDDREKSDTETGVTIAYNF